MALLSARHMQVHAGLLHGLVELLHTSERALTKDQIAKALQPGGLGLFAGESTPTQVVPSLIEVAEWLCLVETDTDSIELSPELRHSRFEELIVQVPSVIRRQMLGPGAANAASADQIRDLVQALAWFLAQDAWDPPLRYERVDGSAEKRQKAQFPNGPEFVNGTKWIYISRWAFYLGLGAMDPIAGVVLPDPTSAVRELVRRSPVRDWSAPEFIDFLAEEVAVLDGGTARRRLVEDLAPDQLTWERDPHVISPSLSLALQRLAGDEEIELIHEADTPPDERRTLRSPTAEQSLDRIRTTGKARADDDN